MAYTHSFTPKRLSLILQAIDGRIAVEEERYARKNSGDDVDGDFGDDLWQLKQERDELATLQADGPGTATTYQCWFDPKDNGLTLLRLQDVERNRYHGQLSDRAVLQYSFIAHTGEEAGAIHALRQGRAPYLPTGEAAPCPTCGANYYSQSYGDCWRCGHIG